MGKDQGCTRDGHDERVQWYGEELWESRCQRCGEVLDCGILSAETVAGLLEARSPGRAKRERPAEQPAETTAPSGVHSFCLPEGPDWVREFTEERPVPHDYVDDEGRVDWPRAMLMIHSSPYDFLVTRTEFCRSLLELSEQRARQWLVEQGYPMLATATRADKLAEVIDDVKRVIFRSDGRPTLGFAQWLRDQGLTEADWRNAPDERQAELVQQWQRALDGPAE